MPDGATPSPDRPPRLPDLSIEPQGGPASRAVPAPLLLGYFDLAVRGTIEYERFSRVYLSPWWELPDVPEGTRAWKRAVLERIPLHGAEHWGHLYLVVQSTPVERSLLHLLTKPTIGTPVAPKPSEVRLTLRDGHQQAELIAQPRTPDTADRLSAFAREIEVRFRRQMD